MRYPKSLLLTPFLVAASIEAAAAEVNVVTSIKPVHSLVSAVMDGVGEPTLLVEGAASPHDYALKPSQAASLEQADIVFWIGDQLETFLEKPVGTIAARAKSVELVKTPGLTKLALRDGGTFDGHDHEHHAGHKDEHDHGNHAEDKHDHDHDKHAEGEHDHSEHAGHKDGHDHDNHAEHKDEHGQDDHAGHDHGKFDAHIWLDPLNAKLMVGKIEKTLAKADPKNAATYKANAQSISARLDTLVDKVSAQLKSVSDRNFVVFHDAYQNFENRFGLTATGSVTVSPEVIPGAKRIAELREKLQELDAACVFSEPQFSPKVIATLAEGTDVKTGVLDPLGTGIEDGPELYFTLIENMATSFSACLAEAG